MIMKRIFSAVLAVCAMTVCTVSAFAEGNSSKIETEDVEVNVSGASAADNWGQSLSIEQSTFNAKYLTENSKIIITYECTDVNESAGSEYPAEIIFQSWDNTTSPNADTDGNVWAKIAPAEFDDTTATYNYESIAEAYGTDDFSQVMTIHVGATDKAKVTCTSMKVTNCKTEKFVKAEEKKAKGTSPVVIIAAVVAGIVVTVVVIVIIMNKKSSEAFDVSKGEFISKKDAEIPKK